MLARILFAAFLALIHTPALADGGSAQVPEGSHLTLFALGLLGVIVGRRAAMRRGKEPRDED